MKVTQPRPSIPVTPRPLADLPARPAPRVSGDGFEPSRSGPVSLSGARPEATPGDRVIELARSVLGQNAHDLKLANNTTLGAAMQDWVGDKVNCANFVSGLLISTGQIPQSEGNASVTGLVSNLQRDPNFQRTTLEQAQPGDVVAFEYTNRDGTLGHHVMVYEGRDANGQPKFLGSNNRNADGTQRISEMTGVPSGWRTLAVEHYRGPNNATTPTAPTGPTTPSGPAASSGVNDVASITANNATWLRNGSSGPAVSDLQQKLKAAGFDPGPIDGQFGPKTRAAVLAFQQARGIHVDGIVGPETRGALLGTGPGSQAPSTGAEPPSTGAEPPSTGATTGANGVESRPGARGTPQQAIEFFMSKGLTRAQAAGIAANLSHESNFNPNAVGDNGTSHGIAQWHNERATAMRNWTRANGFDSNSFRGQLEFLWHELNGSESNALNKLRQTTNAYDAGMSFQRYFERPATINPERGRTAQSYV